MTNSRKTILEHAIAHTCGERDVEYGAPKGNMEDIARLWTSYVHGGNGPGMVFSPEDVAWMMVLVKMARSAKTKKADNYEDAAAYAAIAGEVSGPSGVYSAEEDPYAVEKDPYEELVKAYAQHQHDEGIRDAAGKSGHELYAKLQAQREELEREAPAGLRVEKGPVDKGVGGYAAKGLTQKVTPDFE